MIWNAGNNPIVPPSTLNPAKHTESRQAQQKHYNYLFLSFFIFFFNLFLIEFSLFSLEWISNFYMSTE
jgi:hypothetical protein